MFHDRKSYLRDVSHNLSVCRNKLDSILNIIGWSYHSLQTKALEDLRSTNSAGPSTMVACMSETPETSRNFYVLMGILADQIIENSDNSMYTELVQSIAESSSLKNRKKEDKELLVEMLALERDAKRRRISYKSKVHTKNKSYTEILKEVIGQQMEMLEGGEKNLVSNSEKTDEKRLIELKKYVPWENPYLLWQTVAPEEIKSAKKSKRKRSRERRRSRSRSRDKKRRRRSRSRQKHSKR